MDVIRAQAVWIPHSLGPHHTHNPAFHTAWARITPTILLAHTGESFDVTCMGGFENYSHTRAFGECHPAVLSSVHIRCTDLEMACQSEVSRVTVAIRVAILNGYILDSTTILDSFQDSYQNSYHSSYHITDAKIAIIVAIIVAIISLMPR